LEVYKKSEEFYNILSSFEEKLNQYESSFDKIVKDISTAIAEKIIKRELNKDSIFQDTLHDTLPKIIGANKIVVKINPVELELLEKENRIEVYEKKYGHIKFEHDEKIEKGGCLIETDIGNVDARISSQINEIARQLENSISDKS
jgi:flagellar assembly protein FliH